MALNKGVEILIRYGIAVVVTVLALVFPVVYWIFRPLTVYPLYFFLNSCYDVVLNGMQSLTVNSFEIVIIDACIAGSAYLLLFLLNALTRDLAFKRRLSLFLLSALYLLVLNILRLIVLIVMLVNGSAAFDFTHKLFWYVLSIVFVVVIWLFNARLFKIDAIPFYSDIKFLLEQKKIKEAQGNLQ